jgi:hypothetical protein
LVAAHLMIGKFLIFPYLLIFWLCNPSSLFALSVLTTTDVGELNRLIQPHLPNSLPNENPPTDTFNVSISLHPEENPVIFSIPGFYSLGCEKCHKGESLHLKAANRMRRVLEKLKTIRPKLRKIPLRQYIIQSWSDTLLSPNQFAHTTFDTIRISPAAILIDDKAYQEATHLHESLHLTQKFLGPANELEAYSLNIIFDPRFLLLNFPYFEDTIKTFFIEDFSEMLNSFYARPIRENLVVPKETQLFLAPFNKSQLTHLRKVINTINTLLNEVSQLNQDFPTEFAYLSEQTGNPALLLEIIAAKHLPILDSGVSEETRQKAFRFFDLQMNKKDNIRLGYKINRKKEAFLFLQNQLRLKDPVINLRIYFEYLKKSFIKSDETINLKGAKGEDFNSYILSKVEGIEKMISYEGISQIEREAARKWIKKTCETLLGNCIEVERKN